MASDLNPFLDIEELSDIWLNEPSRSRLENEDEFILTDSEPTPLRRRISSELIQSAERSRSRLSVTHDSGEAKSQSSSGTASFVQMTTVKQECSDGLYRANPPLLAITTENSHQDAESRENLPTLRTSRRFQDPTPSTSGNITNGKTMHESSRLSNNGTNDDLAAHHVILNIDSDGDDDLMIITHDRASTEAKCKWGQHKTQARRAEFVGDNNVLVLKEEPEEEGTMPPVAKEPAEKPKKDFEKIMAAQRALLKNIQSSNSNIRAHARTPNPFQNQVESSRSNDDSEILPQVGGNFHEDITQVDAAMHDGEEDHSWMNEESEADEQYENLKCRHASLTEKEKSGKITNDEMMELFKVERTLQMKERLRAAALQWTTAPEEEEGLFVSRESMEDVLDRHRRNQPPPANFDSDDDMNSNFSSESNGAVDNEATFYKLLQQAIIGDSLGGSGKPELTKSGKLRKKRAKVAKNAREVFEREEARRQQERSKVQKKKARNGSSSSRHRGAATGASRRKGKANKTTTKAGKKHGAVKNGTSLLRSGQYRQYNGMDDIGQMMLEDMMSNDPIFDRLQNPIFNVEPEAPMPGQHRKDTQFQKLFANIPNGDGSKDNIKSVKNDKKMLKEASKSFGYAQVKAQDGKWTIKGMTSTLYHHQLLGAQWMVQRELSSQPPHGGLLADSMGLGKTIQTLACMVGNPPGPEDIKRKIKTTLIVVPAAVIDQWLEEIRTHAKSETFQKFMRYKSSSRIPMEVLEDLDIVVTSYSEVMKQFPFPNSEEREEIARTGYDNWWKTAMLKLGDLHQINWYRVVLDEAQAIKNNSSRTSLACQNLKSVYRWCLTGTPLLNKLEELFPYLRFLKANYSMEWKTFQKYFCDPNATDCYNRIATLLSYTMMRRTMKTTILNRPIIVLPPPHPEIQYINFSPEEQLIYRITENRFRSNLNAFFEQGEARRNYNIFMVQLLRLRQCTSHPFMLERTIKESWTLEDVAELRSRLTSNRAHPHKPFYEQCKLWVEQSEARRAAARERGEEEDVMLPFGQGNFGHKFSMEKALKTLNEKELLQRVNCSVCSDVPDNAVKTDCGHIFCKDCITTYIHSRTAKGDEYSTCPACDRIFEKVTEVRSFEDESDEDSDDRRAPTPSKKKQYRDAHKNSKGKDAMGFEPYTKHSTWLELSDNRPDEFPLTASAKTTALKALLLKGFTKAPFDKVVIYVQFRALARIVGRICRSEDWEFLYLTSDRALEDRTKVITRFREDKNIKILIAGLKCGGLGLNFPWANRCISLDLWWNHAVEQQAFGRIFRIGQKKDTYMTRIVVKNSVDMRLLTMQLHKLTNLEKAIRDGDAKETPNLSLNQLANLFGFLRTDADDNIISIEADYDDEPTVRSGSVESLNPMDESS